MRVGQTVRLHTAGCATDGCLNLSPVAILGRTWHIVIDQFLVRNTHMCLLRCALIPIKSGNHLFFTSTTGSRAGPVSPSYAVSLAVEPSESVCLQAAIKRASVRLYLTSACCVERATGGSSRSSRPQALCTSWIRKDAEINQIICSCDCST